MPAEVPERVAVVEAQQAHYANDVQELRREMAAMRQQLERFIAGAQPVLDAFRDQQQAKARVLNAVAIKVAEWSVVGVLTYMATHAYHGLDKISAPPQLHADPPPEQRR